MKMKYLETYMRMAEAIAETSCSKRLKVGCILVNGSCVVSEGVNGTIPGCWTNVCEFPGEDKTDESIVLHAEQNAICKAAEFGRPLHGAKAFITHAPCTKCASLLVTSGIKEVYYRHSYRDMTGLEHLTRLKIPCYQICSGRSIHDSTLRGFVPKG